MKKRFYSFSLASAILLILMTSCATLQQDVYTYTEDNVYIYNSIEIYEHRFIITDEKFHSTANKASLSPEITTLLEDIKLYKKSTSLSEPYLIARLRAFEGLLYKMNDNSTEAVTAFQDAKKLQKSDPYVQLLGSRLEKNPEKSLEYINSVLAIDKNNAVLILEKGKLFYLTKHYREAVAAIDSAFILFDREGLTDYRTVYNPLRKNIWDLYSISDENSEVEMKESNIFENLTLESMVELTLLNSNLIDNFKSTKNTSTKNIILELQKQKYFASVSNTDEATNTASEIQNKDPVNRRYCARFIWNAYLRKTGSLQNLTTYSEKYKKSGRTKSPVKDITIEDVDFDAILGVVENEFMDLPDGKNFKPEAPVTKLDFLKWIKKISG